MSCGRQETSVVCRLNALCVNAQDEGYVELSTSLKMDWYRRLHLKANLQSTRDKQRFSLQCITCMSFRFLSLNLLHIAANTPSTHSPEPLLVSPNISSALTALGFMRIGLCCMPVVLVRALCTGPGRRGGGAKISEGGSAKGRIIVRRIRVVQVEFGKAKK